MDNKNMLVKETYSPEVGDLTIKSILLHHAQKKDTGVIFITTDNNKAAKIFVKNGEVEAVSMAKLSGIQAALEIEKIGIKAAAYSESFKLPFKKDAAIDSSETLLNFLDYKKRKLNVV